MSSNFSPLSGGGASEEDAAVAAESARRARHALAERLSAKLHALVWLGAAAAILTWGGLWHAVTDDNRATQWLLYFAAAVGTAAVGIAVWLVLWVGRRGVAWEVAAPWGVPAATGAGILALLATIAGVWPIYSLLSPLVVGAVFIGLLFSAHFIPSP